MNITYGQHPLYLSPSRTARSYKNAGRVTFNGCGSALKKLNTLSIEEYMELRPKDKFFLRLGFITEPLRCGGNMDLRGAKYYYTGKNIFEKSYNKLRNKINGIISKRKTYKQVIPIHEQVVAALKENLDKSYGKGNYVLVTIGRSLSSVAKALSYVIGDENVIQIPMTNAKRFCNNNHLSAISDYELAEFKYFLNSVGLTKDIVKKSGKKYIIMDYCCTGASLDGAFNLLTHEKLLGKSENLVKQSIKSALSGTDSKLSQEFDYLLDGEPFKDFSLVNECECLHHTSIAAGITPSRQARLAIFSILDDMIKKNIIKTKK